MFQYISEYINPHIKNPDGTPSKVKAAGHPVIKPEDQPFFKALAERHPTTKKMHNYTVIIQQSEYNKKKCNGLALIFGDVTAGRSALEPKAIPFSYRIAVEGVDESKKIKEAFRADIDKDIE